MNWQFVTFGSSILDFKRPPREMLKIIDESNNILQRTLTTGRNRQGVFSFPFRKNPENTTAYALALKTYKPWVQYFFRDSHSDEHASYLEGPSPLAASVAPIALVWTYINNLDYQTLPLILSHIQCDQQYHIVTIVRLIPTCY